MRALTSFTLFAACFAPNVGWAADVVYKLNADPLVPREEPSISQPAALAIVEREWAAPGVDQSSIDLLPPRKFDFTAPRRFCLENAPDTPWPHITDGGPQWLDDAAWPLTRELFGLGRPSCACDDTQVFTFGGIALQR